MLVSAFFTQGAGAPAAGLALADIDCYLWSRRKSDGLETQLWDGTQHPTEELGTLGAYNRVYLGENFTLYDYFAMFQYVGLVVLDADWSTGVTGLQPGMEPQAGATHHRVIVQDVGANPIADADVWVSSDEDGSTVVASGRSDSNGHFRFWGDTGVTYWIWAQKDGVDFTNPTAAAV